MNKIWVFLFCAATASICVSCVSMQADPKSATAAPARPADLSSLARPQTFTYELRDLYLTQQIDSMSAGGTRRVLVGEDFSTQRKITLTDGATAKIASSDKGSSLTEVREQTDKHFKAEGNADLKIGLKWIKPSVSLDGSLDGSASVGGGYGLWSSRATKKSLEHRDGKTDEKVESLLEENAQTENKKIKKEQELIDGVRLGNYLLRFAVVLRNRDSNDTIDVKGDEMRAYLIGPGLPGGIPVHYRERERISLGDGETFCVFEYRIMDQEQFQALLRLGNQGGLQWLSLKVSDADFPIISKNTGKNILKEEAAWDHDHRPITLVAIDFGDLSDLSPWRVSGKHTKETGRRGTPVTVREALLAVGGVAGKQRKNLPEKVFAFTETGLLAKVVDHPLLERDDDGNYRMFAVLLTKENGKAEPHLPLPEVMNRKIKDYAAISLFDFTLAEFAQNAVLVPAYFDEMKKEIEGYLEGCGENEALQFLKKEHEVRQSEEDDRDLPVDEERITDSDVERFRRRADAGVTNMQYKLARCLLGGWGVESNHVEAVKWFRTAAELGHAKAQYRLGDCYFYGEGVAQDCTKAVEWYRRAAKQGNASAQNKMGDCYYSGEGVAQSYEKAVEWYTRAADQKDAMAQYNLGICSYNGDGLPPDFAKAVTWFSKAAEQGHAEAQNMLGRCYENGNVGKRDLGEAVKWYRKAAEKGNAAAQYALGKCYYDGRHYDEAVEWYRRAAEQGHVLAQFNLGVSYYNGQGVPQNYAEAVKWFCKAAEKGLIEAQYLMGVSYYSGRGVPQDRAEAVKWFLKAAEQGHGDAKKMLKWLKE